MLKHITAKAIFLLILSSTVIAGSNQSNHHFSRASLAVLTYFEKIQGFENYMRSARPGRLAPELKVKLMANIAKDFIASPSAEGRAKLAAVMPVLKFYGRDSIIELIVVKVPQPAIHFYAGAAVLITEGALDMLTAKELLAAVAHELSHEYYWNEWQQARINNNDEKMREIELRCDGMAIITMNELGLDPATFISAITRMTRANGDQPVYAERYTSLDERIRFIRAMIEMVKARSEAPGLVASK